MHTLINTYVNSHFLLDLFAVEIRVEHHDGIGEYMYCISVSKLSAQVTVSIRVLHVKRYIRLMIFIKMYHYLSNSTLTKVQQ